MESRIILCRQKQIHSSLKRTTNETANPHNGDLTIFHLLHVLYVYVLCMCLDVDMYLEFDSSTQGYTMHIASTSMMMLMFLYYTYSVSSQIVAEHDGAQK